MIYLRSPETQQGKRGRSVRGRPEIEGDTTFFGGREVNSVKQEQQEARYRLQMDTFREIQFSLSNLQRGSTFQANSFLADKHKFNKTFASIDQMFSSQTTFRLAGFESYVGTEAFPLKLNETAIPFVQRWPIENTRPPFRNSGCKALSGVIESSRFTHKINE